MTKQAYWFDNDECESIEMLNGEAIGNYHDDCIDTQDRLEMNGPVFFVDNMEIPF